jgi:VanZ family protein
MRPEAYPAHSRMAAITAAVLTLIVYGSLFPFRFQSVAIAGGPFRALLATGFGTDRGDLISNVLLYLPFGFFATLSLRRGPPWVRGLIVTVAGLGLSFLIESAQFYDPGRVPSMADVYANGCGALFGAVGGAVFYRNLPRLRHLQWQPFALLLMATWIGNRLLPYLPSLNPHKYWSALRPVFSMADLTAFDVYRHFAFWLAAALLLEVLFGVAQSRWALPVLIGLTLIARILIIEIILSPSEVLGALLAALAWTTLLSRLRWRAPAIAAIFIVFVALQALTPFHFLARPRAFGWIPFLSFMQTPRESGSRIFLEKTFTYGALVWLLTRSGMPAWAATLSGAAMVFSLRLTQIYLPGRSAEITDTIMLLMAAGVMKAMSVHEPDS